jgi:hypothetical protein
MEPEIKIELTSLGFRLTIIQRPEIRVDYEGHTPDSLKEAVVMLLKKWDKSVSNN